MVSDLLQLAGLLLTLAGMGDEGMSVSHNSLSYTYLLFVPEFDPINLQWYSMDQL